MTILRTVRLAAVQAAPVALDLDASLDKAVALIKTAAAEGAELVVLPECFLSLYPTWAWVGAATTDGAAMDEIYRRMWESAVEIPGPAVERLVQACAETGTYVVIGVNEREPGHSYTLYNTMLTVGPEGILAKHRKLMPTMHERMFHGIGDGDDLTVVDTSVGRVGGLVCWENRMPLARYALYRQAPQVWVAPTADTGDGWQALVRAIAIESGAFVVGAPQFTRASDYPADFPVPLPAGAGRAQPRRCSDRPPRRGPRDRRTAVRRGGSGHRGLRPLRSLAGQGLVRRRRSLQPRGNVGANPLGAVRRRAVFDS